MGSREGVLGQIEALAQSRVNDAVRLAFLSEGELGGLDHLDLSAVTEFKRNSSGMVELKFIDRMAALQWLFEKLGEGDRPAAFESLDRAAGEAWGEAK